MPQLVADSQEVESIADVASGPTTVLHPPQRLAELGRPELDHEASATENSKSGTFASAEPCRVSTTLGRREEFPFAECR